MSSLTFLQGDKVPIVGQTLAVYSHWIVLGGLYAFPTKMSIQRVSTRAKYWLPISREGDNIASLFPRVIGFRTIQCLLRNLSRFAQSLMTRIWETC